MVNEHAIASPSKAAMWLTCANSLAANAGQPEGDKMAADLGTDKHELLTVCLRNCEDAATHIGEAMPKGNTVTEDFAEDVQKVLDSVWDRTLRYKRAGYAVWVDIDLKVPISHITGEKDAAGTADIILCASRGGGDILEVIDAKFGWQEVEAEENPQLLMYASGALEMYDLSYLFSTVRLVIEQPAHGTKEWETTPGAVRAWVNEARKKAHVALTVYHARNAYPLGRGEFTVSEKGCMWCKAKAVCPALTEHVEKSVGCSFEEDIPPPVAGLLPVEELGTAFGCLEMLEDWIKAVRARCEHEMLSGNPVPGLKVVAGRRGNRTWSDNAEAEALMKKFKMKQDQMYSFKLLGPKPILEALKAQPRRLKQIEALIVQPEGKPHVVVDTDPRQALEIKHVEDGFDATDQLC